MNTRRLTSLTTRWFPLGIALVAVLALLVGTAAEAQITRSPNADRNPNNRDNDNVAIQALEIHVQDLGTKREIDVLAPGEVLVLDPGQEVRLRMVAIPAGNSRAPRYPSTDWQVLSGARRVALSQVDARQGSAVLRGVQADDPRSPDSTTLVEFRILDDINLPGGKMKGTITVEVGGVTTQPIDPPVNTPAGSGAVSNRASEFTTVLYRAILLRDPDPGAAGKIDTITSKGYEGLLAVAREMSYSPEARQGVRDRGLSQSDRLAALYEQLFREDPRDVPRSEWNEQLDRIERGDYTAVVDDMLRADRFFQAYNIDGGRGGRGWRRVN